MQCLEIHLLFFDITIACIIQVLVYIDDAVERFERTFLCLCRKKKRDNILSNSDLELFKQMNVPFLFSALLVTPVYKVNGLRNCKKILLMYACGVQWRIGMHIHSVRGNRIELEV